MKKRLIALTICAAFALILLCGCGGAGDKYTDSKYVGTWTAKTAAYAGLTLDAEQVFTEFTLTLESDGDAAANINGESESGSWDESETGIVLTDASNEKMEFTVDGDTLTLSRDGVLITFEQQKAEAS